MKRKIVLFLMVSTVICTLFAGCGVDKNPNETTGSDATQGTVLQDTIERTDPTIATETDATIPGGQVITYTEYKDMNGEQRKDVASKFESKEQFDNWYEEIREDHKDYVETVKPPEIVNPNPTTEPTADTGPFFPDATGGTAPEKDEVTYLDYEAMSGNEQMIFINSFESIEGFFEWYNAAKKAYDDSLIEIDDTPIDAGELLGDKEDKDGN